jgi:hypothetical protein
MEESHGLRGISPHSLAAQHARRNIVLPGEVTQFIELVLDFLHLCLKIREALGQSHAWAIFVQCDARLGNPVGLLGDRCLLLEQGG